MKHIEEFEDLQEVIKNAKKEDIVNQKKIREEFKSYAKEIDQAVIDLYKRIRKPDEDEREFVEPEEEPTTLDELAELHNLNLEVEPLEIPSTEEEDLIALVIPIVLKISLILPIEMTSKPFSFISSRTVTSLGLNA